MSAHPDNKPQKDKVVHVYDGIEECDNALPRWWLWIFFGTITFGAAYWLSAEAFKTTASPRAAYQAEMDLVAAEEAQKMKALGSVTNESLAALAKDGKSLEDGKVLFTTTCAPCHAATGGGGIGPNLTDEFWMHGGAPTKIYGTIKDGVVAKGMPAWGGSLGEERVRLVSAYVLTLKNTKAQGGKAPQGEPEL